MERKTCTICKKDDLSIDQFNWKNKSKGRRSPHCKACQTVYKDRHYKANRKKVMAKAKERRKLARDWYQNFKATLKCNRCPENHPATLQFHREDPAKKELSIAKTIEQGWSVKRIQEEIAKCEVLCANCHSKHHANDRR